MEGLEHILKRRHQLELTLFRRLSPTCRERLTTHVIANADCRSCRDMIDRAFFDHARPDDEAVENAYHHLANRDGCNGARELRSAEAERMLNRSAQDEAHVVHAGPDRNST
jgi:hypothetical protein